MITSSKHVSERIAAGIMIAVLSAPSLAGPCINYANGMRQAQLQRAALLQSATKAKLDDVAKKSTLLKECWDQVVGLDVGALGMPSFVTRQIIKRLNAACEAAVNKVVATANNAVNSVKSSIGNSIPGVGDLLGPEGSKLLGELSSQWSQLSPADQAEALKAIDQIAPGAGDAFKNAQQAAGGYGGSSLPGGSGALMPGGGTTGGGGLDSTSVKNAASGVLGQIGQFFSPAP